MLSLEQCLDRIYPLTPNVKDELKSYFKMVELPAKTILFKEGIISKKLYFIAKGCLRSFYEHKDKDVTLWFANEGDFITCFKSIIKGVPGLENIQLAEDCVLFEIDKIDFFSLVQKHPDINHLYTKAMEENYLYWENRVMMLLFYTAKERYENLEKNSPYVLKRFSLNQIASYLGVTQETLSRIRSKKS